MKYAIICKDKPDHLDLRVSTRPDHVAYLKSTEAVLQAGPFLNEAGDMCGSLIIVEFDSLAEAQDFAANDPYAKAGLFESSSILAWNRVIEE